MNFCKDCQHNRFWPTPAADEAVACGYWICVRPGSPVGIPVIDKVTGECVALPTRKWFCDDERDAGYLSARIHNMCGKEGRFFQPKIWGIPQVGGVGCRRIPRHYLEVTDFTEVL